MKDNLAKEALKRSLLLMKYDTSKTLTENEVKVGKKLLKEGELEQMKALLAKCPDMKQQPINTQVIGEPAMTGQEQEQVAGEIYTAFKGAGTDEESFEKAIDMMSKQGNYHDLCAISSNYQEMAGEDLADGIDGDVGGLWGFGGSLMSKAHTVFRQMVKRTQDNLTVKGQQGQDLNAFNKAFPCVFATAKVSCVTPTCGPVDRTTTNYNFIRVKDDDGKVYQMHLNGDLYDDSTGDFTGYHMKCQSGKPVPAQGSAGMNESYSKKKRLGEWKIPTGGGGNQGGGGGGGATYDQSVANLQQQLLNYGFYLGTSGPKKDGVDGIRGSKTNAAQQAFSNGEKCGDYNKKNNYPNPATCKDGGDGGTPKPQDQEIKMIDPSTF